MLNKELVKYQDKLFWVYKKVKESHIVEGKVQEVKEFWMCDIVLKQKTSSNDEVLIFLREIPEVEIVKD
jgi:hypothetical protein